MRVNLETGNAFVVKSFLGLINLLCQSIVRGGTGGSEYVLVFFLFLALIVCFLRWSQVSSDTKAINSWIETFKVKVQHKIAKLRCVCLHIILHI